MIPFDPTHMIPDDPDPLRAAEERYRRAKSEKYDAAEEAHYARGADAIDAAGARLSKAWRELRASREDLNELREERATDPEDECNCNGVSDVGCAVCRETMARADIPFTTQEI